MKLFFIGEMYLTKKTIVVKCTNGRTVSDTENSKYITFYKMQNNCVYKIHTLECSHMMYPFIFYISNPPSNGDVLKHVFPFERVINTVNYMHFIMM